MLLKIMSVKTTATHTHTHILSEIFFDILFSVCARTLLYTQLSRMNSQRFSSAAKEKLFKSGVANCFVCWKACMHQNTMDLRCSKKERSISQLSSQFISSAFFWARAIFELGFSINFDYLLKRTDEERFDNTQKTLAYPKRTVRE